MSHVLRKGQSPFLKEVNYAEGKSHEYILLDGHLGKIPILGCSFVSQSLFIVTEWQ